MCVRCKAGPTAAATATLVRGWVGMGQEGLEQTAQPSESHPDGGEDETDVWPPVGLGKQGHRFC